MNDLDQISKAIGRELRMMRKASGNRSLADFAFEHQLSRIQYFKMEQGTNCTLKSLIKALNAHNIDFYDFMNNLNP